MTDYLPTVGGTNATQGNGPLAGQTLNFDLNLINFDWTTWYNYDWENWVAVDALLNVAIGFLNIRGIWKANTEYTAGETVFDPNDVKKLYLCQITHTSGTVFATDIAAYWALRTDINPVVTSVHARIGEIVSMFGDYNATEIEYNDSVTAWGATNLQAIIALMTTDIRQNITDIGQAETNIAQNDLEIAALEANRLRINGSMAMTGNLHMSSNRISNLGAATAASDAVRFDQIGIPIPPIAGNSLEALRANAASNALEFATVTAAGWALLDDANAMAMRTTLELPSIRSEGLAGLDLGAGASGNRESFIDFHSYGTANLNVNAARIRRDPGINGDLHLQNHGTGRLIISSSGGVNLNGAVFNPQGGAPLFVCRAWVNFNGTGAVAIRSSGNVSSITDNGTGDYTVNFTTPMPDANYAANISIGFNALPNNNQNKINAYPVTNLSQSLRLVLSNSSSDLLANAPEVMVSIFR